MANKTNSSSFTYDFEYYMDYLDLLPVDAGKLKANRYSIVIALWIGLASFVAFLFLILFYISRSGSTPVKLTMAWFGLLLQGSYCVTSLLLVLFLNQGTGAKRSLTNQNHDDLLADIKP